jgi:hypothetical protein
MSTERLNIPGELGKDLGRLGSETTQEPQKIDQEIRGRKRHIRHVAFGASAVIQRQEDEIDALEEKRQQMEEIAARAERLLGEDEESTRLREENERLRRELEEAREQPPAPPAPEPEPPADATAAPPAAPATRDDTLVPGLPDQPHPVRTGRPIWYVQDWTGAMWVAAFFFAIVGVVVATFTWSPLYGDIHGFGRGLLTTLWYIALIALGFFGGSILGARLERRFTRHRE